MDLINWFSQVKLMFKSVGASPHGGDLYKWSPRDVDAFIHLQQEEAKVDSLRIKSDARKDPT